METSKYKLRALRLAAKPWRTNEVREREDRGKSAEAKLYLHFKNR
jgi:hypothetical protein